MSVDVECAERIEPRTAIGPGISDTVRLLWRPAAIYVASRVVALAAVAYGVWRRGDPGILRALAVWDGSWYLSAAVQGYPANPPTLNGEAITSSIAFFPLYPLMIRGVTWLTGISELAAAIVVAFVAGLAMTILLWLLVRAVCNEQVAQRSVLLVCFFPGSVVLSMAYSESLMLALSMLCLLALLSRRWISAGVVGALATATRPNAVALSLCSLWAAGRAISRDRDWRAVIAPLLTPLGFVGFMLFLWARTGDPFVWFRVQREAWGEHFDFGLRTLQEVWILFVLRDGVTNTMKLQVLGLAFTLLATYLLLRWRPPMLLTLYTAGILFLTLGSWTLGARPRFVLTAFPLIVAVARVVRGRWFVVLLSASTLAMVLLAVVYTAPKMAIP